MIWRHLEFTWSLWTSLLFRKSSNSALSPLETRDGELCCFLALNSALRLAFLRSVEGLDLFLVPWVFTAMLLLVSREKEKSGPMEREKLKT